ncbi:hypothetical protein Vadar_030318 [Vaccinium darrowii]|uniref:Uncharacterized protein n=1 Tax=Vaccinium darrowii TaxID=229202 RepID=A0ACB7Y2T7_9ERIC|nr:hypothetical protein Vadar_030318 [Vaccinium darrowii]
MDIRDVVFDAENIVERFVIDDIKDVVSDAESVVEWVVIDAFKAVHLSLDLESVGKEIKKLTDEVEQIYDMNICDINAAAIKKHKQSSTASGGGSSSARGSNTSYVAKEKVVVGFEDDVNRLVEKLIEGRPLEIIIIIGVGGGGKTTLAREVYDHPFTLHTFEIREWVTVSQDYDKTNKRDLLNRILKSAFPENHEENNFSTDENTLGEQLHKWLKGKKYLIVMDDIWDIKAWNDIKDH